MRINPKALEQLVARTDLTKLLGSRWEVCHWHEDHSPSLCVYRDHGYCFVCGRVVSAVDMVRYYWEPSVELGFKQAVMVMRQNAGRAVVSETVKFDPEVIGRRVTRMRTGMGQSLVYAYLKERWRDISVEPIVHLLDELGLGVAKVKGVAGYLAIPHRTMDGQWCNIKFRTLPTAPPEAQENWPRYWSLPGHSFYDVWPGWYVRKRWPGTRFVFLTEGELDALLILNQGYPAVSVPSGANSKIDKSWFTWKRIYNCYDQDDVGARAARQLQSEHPEIEMLRMCWMFEDGKDVTEAWAQVGPMLRKIA